MSKEEEEEGGGGGGGGGGGLARRTLLTYIPMGLQPKSTCKAMCISYQHTRFFD